LLLLLRRPIIASSFDLCFYEGELGEEVVPAGYRPCCCALHDRRSSRSATLVAKLCDMSQ
jgi:hypothetical protein